jgi:UV DNA damage endonuclease
MSNYILLDSAAYSIYKTTSIMKYWTKSHPDSLIEPDINNSEFLDRLLGFYKKSIEELCQKLNIDITQVICVRDCPIENIWRNKIYKKYKENRLLKCNVENKVGPIVKWLNSRAENIFKNIIRIDECEADDIIYMLVNLLKSIDKTNKITIITNDSDYIQINIDFPDVVLLNPKKMKKISIKNPKQQLQNKIIKGDACDNIPSAKKKSDFRRNRQLIDLTYTPRIYQNRLIERLVQNNLFAMRQIPSNFRPKDIQLGLCCINTILQERDPKIFSSRKPILSTIKKKGIEYLKELSLQNCKDLETMIHWNAQNGIRVFRISSGLFPHMSNSRLDEEHSMKFALPLLRRIGRIARNYKQRLTFHPGQYNVIAAKDKKVFDNTVADLNYHALVLDYMKCDQDSVIVIHAGGIYDDKKASIQRWIDNFAKLPERVRRRLVLENCEKCFSIEDCLYVSDKINIPVVFDTHHFDCYKKLHPDEKFKSPKEYIKDILKTWTQRNMRPKFHVSEQGDGRTGHHSDYIERLPDYLLEISSKYDMGVDIMIEAKMKEQSIFHLYEIYPHLDPR